MKDTTKVQGKRIQRSFVNLAVDVTSADNIDLSFLRHINVGEKVTGMSAGFINVDLKINIAKIKTHASAHD